MSYDDVEHIDSWSSGEDDAYAPLQLVSAVPAIPASRPRYLFNTERPRTIDLLTEFTTIVTPLRQMAAQPRREGVKVIFHREGSRTTLQWEPFAGIINENAAPAILIHQTIIGMPAYAIEFPIVITYNGRAKVGIVMVDPHRRENQVAIYLDPSKSGQDIRTNDTVAIPGTSISWLSN